MKNRWTGNWWGYFVVEDRENLEFRDDETEGSFEIESVGKAGRYISLN